jgi:peptidyl-prolyl cis-trans isomerase D
MLQAFRKHAYSWTIRVLLLILGGIFTFFFGGLGSYFTRVRPVATVDGQRILPDQIDQEVIKVRNSITNRYGQNAGTMLEGLNLRQIAVDQLIQQILITKEAHRLGLQISDENLEKVIESQTAFQLGGRFDVLQYQNILRSNDLEPADYERDTRDQILTDTLRLMITDAVQMSASEARDEFNQFNEKLSLAYIEIPYANFTTGIQPTDKELSKFYQENQDLFREPERAKIVFIRYDPAAVVGKTPPSDEAIEEYYQRNLETTFTHPREVRARHILISVPPDATPAQRTAARAKADKILQEFKAGGDFAKLAKQYSDDPGTRDNGGDLGSFRRGEMVKPFEDAAFKLQPGQMDIVESQFGYHIIQVESVSPAHTDTLQEARPKIVTALKLKEGDEVARQDADQDVAAALVGRSLDELAKKRGLVAVETPYFTQNETLKGAEDNPKLAQAAFALKPGQVRPMTNGPVPFLVKVLDHKAARIPPLNEIKDLVRQTLVRVTAESKANEAATAMLKQIKTAADFGAVAVENHLQVKTTGDFPRSSRTVPGVGTAPQATEGAAAVPTLPGVIDRVIESGGNSFIFEAISRTPPSEEQWKSEGPAFTEQLLERRRAAAWLTFVGELKGRAQIVVNSDELGGGANG